MKRISKLILGLALIFTAVLSGCGINNQARQIKALENCTYKIVDVQDVTVAGVDLDKIFKNDEINLAAIPSIAIGLLTKDVPLKSTVLIEINNPTSQPAAINQFDYIVQLSKEELVNGTVETPLNIQPGSSITVPVKVNTNIHRLVTNKELLNQVLEVYRNRKTDTSLGELTVKLKPTFQLGKSTFKYPGYINIKKNIELNRLFTSK